MIFKTIGRYTVISFIAGTIDFLIAYFLYTEAGFHYMLASNLGIAVGFIFQFLTGMKYVFNNKNFVKSLIVYIASLIFGVFLSNGIVWVSFDMFKLSFAVSKLLSMLLPFFVVYFIRKVLLQTNLK